MVRATQETVRLIHQVLADRRAPAFSELKEALRSPRFQDLLDSLDRLSRSDDVEAPIAGITDEYTAKRMGARVIRRALKRVSRWRRREMSSMSDDDLHELRIQIKALRYICEFFTGQFTTGFRKTIKSFVRFQDCLGYHQDAQVACDNLERMVGNLDHLDSDTLLSFGALMQVQRNIAEAKRRDFQDMWKVFPDIVKSFQKHLKV
jgi:CHAD domain-containing protein